MNEQKPRKAVYAASLDPITNGHINIIERMAPLYDELIVLVAVAASKNYTFTQDERVAMAQAAVAHLSNVRVDVCIGQYVVTLAASLGADVIIRGLRNSTDLEFEQTLSEENRRICPNIQTIFVPCVPELMHVSSSMVKGHVGVDPSWEKQVARSVPPLVVKKLKEKQTIKEARVHWAKLMADIGHPAQADHVFTNLVRQYTETHREYHTLEHIVTMLDDLSKAVGYDRNLSRINLEFAIWFHDVIYNPKKSDNEKRSADYAKFALESTLKPVLGQHQSRIDSTEVQQLIMLATHAQEPDTYNGTLLIDLDLAILGKSTYDFDTYEAGIRYEYAHVPAAEFAEKRIAILEKFLARPFIYHTEFFREQYERSAHFNLQRSIEWLRISSTP